MKNTVFLKYSSLTVISVFLLFFQIHISAALVVLPRPVPLQAETVSYLRQAHVNQRDHWQLVVFGFTRCKDICPTSLANMSMLIQSADAKQIKLVGTFVSVDPDRDSESALSDYTNNFDSKISYLRLEDEELEQFKAVFGVEAIFYTKNTGNQLNYQLDHSTTAFLVDPAGRIRIIFDAAKDAVGMRNFLHENKELFDS